MQKFIYRGDTMTKNRKIEILVEEINGLNEENKRLRKLSNEELSKEMLKEIKRYGQIMDKLCESNKKLNELRFLSLMNTWKYRWMIWCVKMKKLLKI